MVPGGDDDGVSVYDKHQSTHVIVGALRGRSRGAAARGAALGGRPELFELSRACLDRPVVVRCRGQVDCCVYVLSPSLFDPDS